ncbi:hypothetical protein ACFSUK_34035 [Sphingobium scionense]
MTSAGQVNAGTIKRYLAFLALPDAEGKRLKRPTIATQLGLIRPLLERAEQADPKLFGSVLAFPYNPVPGSRIHDSKPRLCKEDLQAILMACYEEIDAAWAKFQRCQMIIAALDPPPRAARERASTAPSGVFTDLPAASLQHGSSFGKPVLRTAGCCAGGGGAGSPSTII